MALTDDEQRLYNFARDALPSWIKDTDEFLTAAAKLFGGSLALSQYLFDQALITHATGATSTTPDWLAQHARDRGTSRQLGEGDPALQQRLRTTPDALTRQALLDSADAILDAAGVAGEAALLELPRDAAWLGTFQPLTGTGGSFVAGAAGRIKFTPDELPWATPPFRALTVFPSPMAFQISISSVALPTNAEDATIESLDGNAAVYPSIDAIPGSDPALTWVVNRFDALNNLTDGFARSFCGRGWRTTRPRPFGVLVILPFGTSAGTAASVLAAIRGKKAAGFKVFVERRVNP